MSSYYEDFGIYDLGEPRSGVRCISCDPRIPLPPKDELLAIIAAERKHNRLPIWMGGHITMYWEGIPESEEWEPIIDGEIDSVLYYRRVK